MHEFAITDSMVRQVLDFARTNGGRRIRRIKLTIGESAGVVPDCVGFYFDQMKSGTLAEDAVLEFRRTPLVLRCPKCRQEFSDMADICACNAGADVLSGQEIVVDSIELDDARS